MGGWQVKVASTGPTTSTPIRAWPRYTEILHGRRVLQLAVGTKYTVAMDRIPSLHPCSSFKAWRTFISILDSQHRMSMRLVPSNPQSSIQFHLYESLDHDIVSTSAQPDYVRLVNDRFDGVDMRHGCSRYQFGLRLRNFNVLARDMTRTYEVGMLVEKETYVTVFGKSHRRELSW
jgi:hypothetical protein